MQQQRLIEFIREGKIEEALEFAQEELAPRGEENSDFLEELEKTMALFAFDGTDKSNPVAYLLDHSQRQKTASELNAAILSSQCQEKGIIDDITVISVLLFTPLPVDPKLPQLLKLLMWSQEQLSKKLHFPQIKNIATAELDSIAKTGDAMET